MASSNAAAVAITLVSLLMLAHATSVCWPGSNRASLSDHSAWPERFQLTALAYQPELDALAAMSDTGKLIVLHADTKAKNVPFLMFIDLNTNNDWEGADWINTRTLALVAMNPPVLAALDINSQTLLSKPLLGMPSRGFYWGAEGVAVVPGPSGLLYAYVGNSADGNVYVYEFVPEQLSSPSIESLSPCGLIPASWMSNMTDISDISYEPETGTMWLLYDKDNRVVRLSMSSNVSSALSCAEAAKMWSMSANFPLNQKFHQTGIAVYNGAKTMAIGNYGPDKPEDQLNVFHLGKVPVADTHCGACSTDYSCPTSVPPTCTRPGQQWSCVKGACWLHVEEPIDCIPCDTLADCPQSIHSTCLTRGVQYSCTSDRVCEATDYKGVCDNNRAFAIIVIIIALLCLSAVAAGIYVANYRRQQAQAAQETIVPLPHPDDQDGSHLEGFSNDSVPPIAGGGGGGYAAASTPYAAASSPYSVSSTPAAAPPASSFGYSSPYSMAPPAASSPYTSSYSAPPPAAGRSDDLYTAKANHANIPLPSYSSSSAPAPAQGSNPYSDRSNMLANAQTDEEVLF